MPVSNISQLLSSSMKDDALVRHLLGVWPVIESILEAFSKATQLPLFIFFNDTHVFQSSLETMPSFCINMLGTAETQEFCISDGQRRASKEEPDIVLGIQLCHAGMINGRREIETGIGTLTILFGAKMSRNAEAMRRRDDVIQSITSRDALLAERLRADADADQSTANIEPSDLALMDAITDIVQRLVNATVGFRSLTINMAHELSLMLLGMGLLTNEFGEIAENYKNNPESVELAKDLLHTQTLVHTQCRLGLYIVRNFLSHASETRYKEVVRPHFREVNLEALLVEMVELHRLQAAKKDIVIENEASGLPAIFGSDMEIRRLFNNIINNAIKYSYHSIPGAKRTIKIKSKVPYDPGFRKRRFSITFENYGLGLTEEERHSVFMAGFRGRQAIAEVPIGSGIGLSEAAKIAKLHSGEIKLQSKELYKDDEGRSTYLTTVDLVFPYTTTKTRF